MRIIAKISSEPTFWVDNVHDVTEVRSSVRVACSDFLFIIDPSQREMIVANLRKVPVEQSKIILEGMFPRFSVSGTQLAESQIDMSIGIDVDSGLSFSQYETDKDWQQELKRRKKAVAVNESREKAFERLLNGLLSTSRHIQIVDPYAATNIIRQKGRVWLLEKIFKVPKLKIEIYSRPPTTVDRKDQRSQSQLDDKLDEHIAEIKKRFSNLEIRLIDPPHAQFHNRRIRIHNDTQQIALVVERGVDVFDELSALEQQTFSEMDAKDFQKHWDRLGRFDCVIK